MAYKKVGALKNAIAGPGGFYSPTGEKLKGAKLTQAEIDAFNGKKKAKAKKVEAPVEVVDIVEIEEDIEDDAE